MRAENARQTSRYFFPKPYADFVQRLRVVAGFLLLTVFAWASHPSPRSMEIGVPVSTLGLALRAWAAGHLAKDRELATGGPFAYLRNPLYAGTLVAAAGIVLAARNVWLAIVTMIVFLFVYLPAIELEEQHLREIFPRYATYAEAVRRFVPGKKYGDHSERFSAALYLRNEEYKAALGWLIATAWLAWRSGLL